MARDLGQLALRAFPSPFTDVLSNRRPYDLGTNCLPGPFHTRVPQSMYGVEDRLPKREWYEWSGGTIAYINEELMFANIDRFEI